MQRDDPSGSRPGGPAPAGSRGEGAGPGTDGDAVLAALAHRLRARSERQQLLTERLRSGELRPGALADLAELAAAARRGARDGDHILVMSGTPPTSGGGAVPLGQALSTAVAASEAASRTVVPPAPSVSLDGSAETVFGQILAELLAHAVTTTGPGERLELHLRWAPDGGVVLELLCARPAQNRAPIEDLDRMLAAGRPDGPVAPHEIGLYVAARLARAIGARLGTRSAAGTQAVPGLSPVAVLQLPPSLLAGGRGGGQDPVRAEDLAVPGPDADPGRAGDPVTTSVPAAGRPASPWPPLPGAAGDPTPPAGQARTGRVPADDGPATPAARPMSLSSWRRYPNGALPTRGARGPGVPPPFTQPSTDVPPVTEAMDTQNSTPPVELFGPFDSEPPVPVDDMDGTPIFAAVASAWFRDPEAGSASPPTTALPATGSDGARSGGPGPQNWSTVGDAEFEAARARANRVVESPTTARGLPQRRPGQQMVPPSRRNGGGARHASSAERQPDRVRNRLASYQRGLREGRHRAAEEAQSAGGNGPEEPGNGAGSLPWPNDRPMASAPGTSRSGAHAFRDGNGPNGVTPFGGNGRNVG